MDELPIDLIVGVIVIFIVIVFWKISRVGKSTNLRKNDVTFDTIGKPKNLRKNDVTFDTIGKPKNLRKNHVTFDTIGKPKILRVNNVTFASVDLEWTKPVQERANISSYTILCRPVDDPQEQWLTKWTSTEEKVKATGLLPRTKYVFKIRPECGSRHGEESDSSSPVETKPKIPGKIHLKPFASCITQDSVVLKWREPVYGKDLVKKYYVYYGPIQDSDEQWKKFVTEGRRRVAVIHGLRSDTEYTFKVYADGEYGVAPDSDSSLPIKTHKLLSKLIKEESERLNSEGSLPEMYMLPMTEVMHKTVGGHKLSKCIIGTPPKVSKKHKTKRKVLMLVGATGSGKTTLLNGIANYVLGIRFEDNFRFKINSDEDGSNQAHSQTSSITAYTFYPMEGSKTSYSLTVIDTPGFGDTKGIKRDKEIVTQIRKFFSTEGVHKVHNLNGVGIVLESSSARLTSTQKYIFDSILGIFGENISSKIFLMITFADGQEPPVLSAAHEAQIPYVKYFKFNNSALFAPTTDNFTQIFWDMGMNNFDQFFTDFGQSIPVSIGLTNEVLKERERLESILQGLEGNIAAGLDNLNELHTEEYVLEEHESEMKTNERFEYKVKVVKRQAVKTSSNRKALNCHQCFTTCHYPCDLEENKQFDCLVMNDYGSEHATCNICPSQCSWDVHFVQNFRYESFEGFETRTIKELKKRYDKASDRCKEAKDIIDRLEDDLSRMQENIIKMVRQAKKCKQRLNEIALKPGKLTEVDYIDLLILNEKIEKKCSYLERIEALEHLKEAAKLLAELSDKDSMPDEMNMKKWWKSFRRDNP